MNETFTVQVPVHFKKQGARRLIFAPPGTKNQDLSMCRQTDPNLVNALINAWHWQKMIETRQCRNVAELAEKEKVTTSYASRILRLNSLAPDIKLAILDGRQPKSLRVQDMMSIFPEVWDDQRIKFDFSSQD